MEQKQVYDKSKKTVYGYNTHPVNKVPANLEIVSDNTIYYLEDKIVFIKNISASENKKYLIHLVTESQFDLYVKMRNQTPDVCIICQNKRDLFNRAGIDPEELFELEQ